MKATVTRIFTLSDNQIESFMSDRGWEPGEYDDTDVDNELAEASASEIEEYGECDFFNGNFVDVED